VAENVIEYKIKGDSSDAKKAFGDLDGAIGGVTKALGAAAVAYAAVKLGSFVNDQIKVADEFSKMSQRTGVAIDTLSQLDHAFELAGLTTNELESSFKFLNKSLDEAKQGNDAARISFDSVGLSMKDIRESTPDEVLLRIADAFVQIEDPSARTTLLLEKFGKAGTKLAPAFAEGRAGVEKFMNQADAMNKTIDAEFGKAAERFNDNMTNIGNIGVGTARGVAKMVLPIFNDFIETIFKFGETGTESIVPWGKIVVNTVGHVATAVLALKSIFTGLTDTIVGSFKAAGQFIADAGLAAVEAAEGNFKAAGQTIRSGWDDMGKTATEVFSGIDADMRNTAEGINKINQYMDDYNNGIKRVGESAKTASSYKFNYISKAAAAELETYRKAQEAFINSTIKLEQTATGNKLALLDQEFKFQMRQIEELRFAGQAKVDAELALQRAYAAQRQQIEDGMLAGLGISDAQYRGRQHELISQEAAFMVEAGLSQIQADQFVKTRLLELQASYLEAKNTALGEDYLTQDEITLARDEAERLRLETNYANQLITKEQYDNAIIELEIKKQAKLGNVIAQAEAARLQVSKMTLDQQLAYTSTSLNSLTGLMQTQSKAGFRIGKAAAIAQATINAYTAATGAYASAAAIPFVGWILGPIAAIAALALGMANVQSIRSQQMGQAHAGMTNVPSEGSYLLDKGERVIQPEQNRDLTNFLGGGGGGGDSFTVQTMEVHILENATSYDSLMKMDDRELREVVAGKLYAAFNVLDKQGVRPNFVERYAR